MGFFLHKIDGQPAEGLRKITRTIRNQNELHPLRVDDTVSSGKVQSFCFWQDVRPALGQNACADTLWRRGRGNGRGPILEAGVVRCIWVCEKFHKFHSESYNKTLACHSLA